MSQLQRQRRNQPAQVPQAPEAAVKMLDADRLTQYGMGSYAIMYHGATGLAGADPMLMDDLHLLLRANLFAKALLIQGVAQ